MKTILLAMLLASCVDAVDTDEPAPASTVPEESEPRSCSTDTQARPAIAELPAADARMRRGAGKAAELGTRERVEWNGSLPPPQPETARALDEYLARSVNLDATARAVLKRELLAR